MGVFLALMLIMSAKILPDFLMMKDQNNALYDQLLPLYQSDELDSRLAMLMPTSTKAQQLIVKIEIRRRMSRCTKSIDLRGKVAGECRPYFLLGKTHWFDDVAINTYHRRIDIYQQQMTQGLWEELHQTPNSYRVIQQEQLNAPAAIIDSKIETVPMRFGYALSRREHRIQISSRVLAFLPDGIEVHGSTIDISNSGMRIKLPSSFSYEIGKILTIYLPQLGDECQIPALFSGLEYRIIGHELNLINDNYKRLRMQLVTQTTMIEEAISFKIAQNAKKPRVENEDKILSLRIQSYEQLFLDQSPSLPLFFNQHELKYCLLTAKNKPLWDYWHDERHLPVISHLCSAQRLAKLTETDAITNETWVYCFTHTHFDKTHFFSATPDELTPDFRRLFWHLGSIRPSWRVLRLCMEKITLDNIEQLQNISPCYMPKLNGLTHVLTIQDLTLSHSNSDFRLPIKPRNPVKQINQFLHPRAFSSSAEPIPAVLQPQRKEPRYIHKISTHVNYPSQGELDGETIDFSPHGLHLRLTQPFTGNKLVDVCVTFPHLQRVDSKAPLTDVPYKVMRINENRTEITLSLIKNRHSEESSHYLKRLIEHNRNKLQLDSEYLPDPPLVQAMHQLCLSRLLGIPYFLSKQGESLQLSAIGINTSKCALALLLQQAATEGKMSLQHIFDKQISKYASAVTRQHNQLSQIAHEIYLAVELKDNAITHIEHRNLTSFSTPEERIFFISQARKKGEFFAIRNWMQPIENGRQYLNTERIENIMKESVLKARQINQEFTQLCVYGELCDITEEVLLRLEIA